MMENNDYFSRMRQIEIKMNSSHTYNLKNIGVEDVKFVFVNNKMCKFEYAKDLKILELWSYSFSPGNDDHIVVEYFPDKFGIRQDKLKNLLNEDNEKTL